MTVAARGKGKLLGSSSSEGHSASLGSEMTQHTTPPHHHPAPRPHPPITDRKGKHPPDGRAWRLEMMRVSDGGSSGVISVIQADVSTGRFYGEELRSIHFLFVSPPPADPPTLHTRSPIYMQLLPIMSPYTGPCATGNQSCRPRTRCSALTSRSSRGGLSLSLYCFNCLHSFFYYAQY